MIGQDIKRIQTVGGHILGAVFRAFGKVVGFFLLFGVIGAGIIEGTAFGLNNSFGKGLTNITAIAFGVVLGYAAGITTAVVEAIRALIDAGKEATAEAEKVGGAAIGDVGKVAGGTEGVLGGLVKGVEAQVGKLEHRQ